MPAWKRFGLLVYFLLSMLLLPSPSTLALDMYTLTTNVVPSQGGTVRPDCSAPCQYPGGTAAHLLALPGSGYVFDQWSGACTGTNPAVSVSMTEDRVCTATFTYCPDWPLRRGGYSFDTFREAYDAPIADQTIRMLATTLQESIRSDDTTPVTLRGGYRCGFTDNPSFTLLQGQLIGREGPLTLENVMVLSGTPPVISSFSANPMTIQTGKSATLTWAVADAATVSINQGIGAVDPVVGSRSVSPTAGTTYLLTATNPYGVVTKQVTVAIGQPVLPVITAFSASPDVMESGQSATLTWAVSGALSVHIDQGIGAVNSVSGSVQRSLTRTTAYTITASNADGTVEKTITVGVMPPDPATVAPPIDQTVATSVHSSTEFLYTGVSPIQTGVAPETIDAKRVALIRGKVLNRDNNPLPGVTITVLNHPEYGQTITRPDGMFDMVVNGGGLITVNYRKTGYLPAQRQSNPAWEGYSRIDDTVLIAQDTRLNTIDLTDTTQSFHVAQGSVVTDDDGARQITLLIPQGTQAQVYNEDGSTRTMTNLGLRLTEYTVGSSGPAAMPALLPPASAYTYAVELKAEEATLKRNGKDLLFDRPVPFYVTNFLGFPVGSAVPVGYYDSDKAAWVASENGRVIKILAIGYGSAELDTDGDGLADDAAKLGALGITSDELVKLGSLYAAGDTLWRVQVNHLSTFDCNWPYGPPMDAEYPGQPDPSQVGRGPNDPCEERGSVIECQSQVLGESLRLAGTPYRLHYRSNRVPGFSAGRVLRIPLSGTSVPDSLWGIRLEVEVAGQHFSAMFSPTPNQVYHFVWDGLDGYGRRAYGWHKANVRIGYVYRLVYYPVSDDLDRAFARVVGRGTVTILGREVPPSTFALWQKWQGKLFASLPDQGLGGWSLTPHHVYDPAGSVLYRGDGQRVTGQESLSTVTSVVAGGGIVCERASDPCGDGGPATSARLGYVRDLAVAPDGTIFIAEQALNRIRKVDTEGIITTIAGNGQPCFYQTQSLCGDNGPAALATTTPFGLVVGLDGSLYILEYYSAVRRIRPDGVIEKVAGRNPADFRPGVDQPWAGDGGPATDAFLLDSWDLASGPDGSLYVSQHYHHCVRQIGTDGYIATAAGKCGVQGFSGDGGPGPDALLRAPIGLSNGEDGSLYIADWGNYRVRRLRPDGTIETAAGAGYGTPAGDGGSALDAKIGNVAYVATGRDGSLFLGEEARIIRRVGTDGVIQHFAGVLGDWCSIPREDADLAACGIGGPAASAEFGVPRPALTAGPDGLYASSMYELDWVNVPVVLRFSKFLLGMSLDATLVPSQDGQEIYIFDWSGRHAKTVDAYTGADRYRFTYDSRGLLSGLADRAGNVTTIERDSSGNLMGVAGPYGHRTAVTLNANGYLDSLTDPAGAQTTMVYDPDGLLLTFTDANGHTHWFEYDDLGFLRRDEDAAGGASTLARTEGGSWREVTLTSGAGKVTMYRTEVLPTGDTFSVNRFPDGSETRVIQSADGTRETLLPDGSSVTTVQRGDPRFGMNSPVTTSALVLMPSSLTAEISASFTADLTNPADVMSFTKLAKEVTLNGRTYRQIFDRGTRVITMTTPGGRVTTSALDSAGRLVDLHLPGLTPIVLGYDGRGRLNQVRQGDSRQYLITYDAKGMVQSITDPLGRVQQFRFNEADRPVALVSPGGQETGFESDHVGNLTGLRPPGQPTHDLSYTQTNLLARYDPPSLGFGASTTLVYDADRRVERIARSGQVASGDYDTAGRVTSITLPGDAGSYFYEYGPVTRRMARATAPGGQVLELAHDGFLLTGESWSGPVSGAVSRTYDSDLRLSSQAVNGGAVVAFGYDPDGLPTSAGELSIQRDPATGFITGATLGGLSEAFGYDAMGNLASLTLAKGISTLYSAHYTRDALGRVTEKREDTGGPTRILRYTYDVEGRVASVEIDGSQAETFTYDPNGNRLTASGPGGTRSATYDAQDRLLSFGTATYGYTLSGDLQSRTRGSDSTTYSYDELGNLLGVTLADGREIGYIVDGRGRRVGKTVGGTLVQGFLYQNLLRPVAELDGSGAVVSEFVYGTRDDLPDYMVRGGRTYLFVADHLGSPRLVVDAETGAVEQSLKFDAYGNVVEDTNRGFQPFGFAGGLYDPDTKLVRFGRRDYDAEVGRWTTKDPALFDGGSANLYEYVRGDPVNLIDPTGLSLEWFLATSPWLVGFADGLTMIPFTHTSVSELIRERRDLNDLVDYCSYRYRAGHSMGEAAQLLGTGFLAELAIFRAGAMTGRPLQALSGRDVWIAFNGIRGLGTLGSRFGREFAERADEP